MNFIIGISLYFSLMMAIGYFASRRVKTMEDYLIAGRRLPFFLAVPTIVATWFGAGSCMGVSGTVYSQGFYGVLSDPFGCSLALVIAGLFFAAPFRRMGLLTISDLLEKVYGGRFERVTTAMMIPFYIGTLASQMLAMGYVFHAVFGGSTTLGVLIGSLIVLTYTISGGMWAVTITDFIQMGLLVAGLILILPVTFEQLPDPNLAVNAFLSEFSNLVPHDGANWQSYAGRILLTALGAIMGQDLLQRSMASRSIKVARTSAITAGGIYFCLGLIPLFIGIAGRYIFPQMAHPEQMIPLMAEKYLSPALFTLFACGLFSAIMSTADSYLLAGTSLITRNILLKLWPIKEEKRKIRLLRLVNLLLALLALCLALSGQSIFDMMVHSGATLFIAIFVPVSAALFLKKSSLKGAWGAVFGGIGTWLGVIILQRDLLTALHYEDVLFGAAAWGGLGSLLSYVIGAAYEALTTKKEANDALPLSG